MMIVSEEHLNVFQFYLIGIVIIMHILHVSSYVEMIFAAR